MQSLVINPHQQHLGMIKSVRFTSCCTLVFIFRCLALGNGLERHVVSRKSDPNPRQILLSSMASDFSRVVESQSRLCTSDGMVFGMEEDAF